MLDAPIANEEIVITAARVPQEASGVAASVTIIDKKRIERLGEPLVPALLRLGPSTAVATSGPAGSLTEVRIRGAEANHTLLFIDGIRANDPAAGNTPRFELLNADIASRIELVRGPQSALWGSEAIGGVIAVDGAPRMNAQLLTGQLEVGSFGFRRASAAAGLGNSAASISAAVGWQRADGIDSFDGEGDRDGYRNLSGRLRGSFEVSPSLSLGASAIGLSGRSEFDGFSPVTFQRADTLDSSRNRLLAGRVWAQFGTQQTPWSASVSTAVLGSSNHNLLAGDEVNRTRGRRWTVAGQVETRFATGSISHQLIAAADHEAEEFRARDFAYDGFSNQDRNRKHQALTLEWRTELGPVTGDISVRRDMFNRFQDATSLRASVTADIGSGFSVAGSYGEGIAQPTFFDLYGFFPGSFVGNSSLRPESSRGVEASVRYRRSALSGALTWYRQGLKDEIVDVFDPATFLSSTANRQRSSRRSGVEAELGWAIADQLRLSANYAYLKAAEPGTTPGTLLREVRRPRHSGSLALDGLARRFTYGASLAYSGERRDMNFDVFPAAAVRLDPYWLAGARLAYSIRPGVELFARAANAFDRSYQEVFGYRTEGRSVHAGVRLAAGR